MYQLLRSSPLRLQPRRSTAALISANYTMVHAPSDWKSKAPRPLPSTTTFSKQDALPRLPVPELDATLVKLEKTLRPLARNPQELAAVQAKIQALGASGGFGRTLHERLVARAQDPDMINWLENFWDDVRPLITIDVFRVLNVGRRLPT